MCARVGGLEAGERLHFSFTIFANFLLAPGQQYGGTSPTRHLIADISDTKLEAQLTSLYLRYPSLKCMSNTQAPLGG